MKKKTLTKRQKTALARHKRTHGHTKKHIAMMRKLMLGGKGKKKLSFPAAHNKTMRKIGK